MPGVGHLRVRLFPGHRAFQRYDLWRSGAGPWGQNFSWKPASGRERVRRIGANGSAAVGSETAVELSAGAGVGVTPPPRPASPY